MNLVNYLGRSICYHPFLFEVNASKMEYQLLLVQQENNTILYSYRITVKAIEY
jgi:hypothetical protein